MRLLFRLSKHVYLDNRHIDERVDRRRDKECEVGESNQERLHGTLDLLVLRVLSEGPLHGYAIAKRLRSLSGEVVSVEQGSLYPSLYRMQKRGWLKASWGTTDQNRRAKFYQLTRSGERQLTRDTKGWEEFAAAVSSILRSGSGDS